MNDKDKERIAKIDLIKAKALAKRLKQAEDDINTLIYSLQGTAIRYDREHVQTSPENAMENIFARVDEIERRIAKDKLTLTAYRYNIERVKHPTRRNVLLFNYIYCMTYKQIADVLKVSRERAYAINEKALVDYYNTNYCRTIDC